MKVVVDNLESVEPQAETRRVELVTKRGARAYVTTYLLSSPARVVPVVVIGHGRVEGKVGLKALLCVSKKYPPQLVLGALHKGVSCGVPTKAF
jgi:hypothetical protein